MRVLQSPTLSPGVLSELGDAWESRPCVLRDALVGEALETPSGVLNGLNAVRGYLHDPSVPLSMSIMLDGGIQVTDLEPAFPRGEASLSEFLKRMDAEHRSYTLTVYHWQFYSDRAWHMARAFLHSLPYDYNERSADLDCFVGTYDRTVTGVHLDAASNFSYIVSGTKTMEFWPADSFTAMASDDGTGHLLSGRTSGTDVEGRLVLTAEPGDVIYWPSSFWHIATGNVQSVTLNIALYAGGRRSTVRRALMQAISSMICEDRLDTGSVDGCIDTLAAELAKPDRIRDWHSAVEVSLLRRQSSIGFDCVPALAEPRVLRGSDVIAGRPWAPIVSAPAGTQLVRIAVGGHVATVRDADFIQPLVDALNSGEAIFVDRLIGDARRSDDGSGAAGEVLKLLRYIEAAGGLVRVPQG